MTKQLDLCGRCAEIFAEAYRVERVAGGCDHKVTCENCRKRRYGGKYVIKTETKMNSQ